MINGWTENSGIIGFGFSLLFNNKIEKKAMNAERLALYTNIRKILYTETQLQNDETEQIIS